MKVKKEKKMEFLDVILGVLVTGECGKLDTLRGVLRCEWLLHLQCIQRNLLFVQASLRRTVTPAPTLRPTAG